MSNEQNPQQPQQQVISLQAISQNFFGALQRQFDLLAYNLAAGQSIDAEKYEQFAHQVKIMPVQQLHAGFAQVQAYSRGLMIRQTINDLLGMAAACMDNCHLLCQLIKNQKASKENAEAANKTVSEAQGAFVRSALQDKFETFDKNFGVMCELEDSIIAFAIGLRVLMQRNGIVAAEDLDGDGELVFEFKTAQIINPPKTAPEQKPELRIVDTRRAFKAGDHIELSNSELLGLNVTMASFFNSLFRAVAEYGQKNGEPTAAQQN